MKRKQFVSLLLCAALAFSTAGGAGLLPTSAAPTAAGQLPAQGQALPEQASRSGRSTETTQMDSLPEAETGQNDADPDGDPPAHAADTEMGDADSDQEVVVKDPVLRGCMLKAGWDENSDGKITRGEMEKQWMLFSDEGGISDLTGLEYAVNLTNLTLQSSSGITDLTPLTGLKKLSNLNLAGCGAVDLTPLAGLTNISYLNLSGTPATALSPLSGLVNMRTLSLNDMPVVALPDCTKMLMLETLEARNTGITDLTPLLGPVNLSSLDLSGTPITDLTPLLDLYVQNLSLRNCTQLTDISPLYTIVFGMKSIALSGSGVSVEDRARLLNFPDEIRALPEKLIPISPIGVYDEYEFVSDNPAIQAEYKVAHGDYIHIITSEPCSGTLSIYGDGDLVKKIRVTAPLTPDEYVRIPDQALCLALRLNGLTDDGLGIFTLAQLSSVTQLQMEGQGITDLTGLEYATSLISLDLRNNHITDLTPLSGLDSLKNLQLDGNEDLVEFGSFAGKRLDTLTVENTGLSREEQMKMFYFKDSSSVKGEYAKFQTGPEGIRYLPKEFTYEVDNPGIVRVVLPESGAYHQYQGMVAGTTQITAKWGELPFSFSVTVEGIDPDQPVGPDEAGKTKLSMYGTSSDCRTGVAIRPNGELLALHNGSSEKLGNDFDTAKMEESCYNGKYPGRLNAIGRDGTLWTWEVYQKQQSVSECFTNPVHYDAQIIKTDGNYALTGEGDLIDLWLGETVLTGVTDWTTTISTRADRVTWALCENGKLYTSNTDETGTLPFSLYWDEGNVIQLESGRFLQDNGCCYSMDFSFGEGSSVAFTQPEFIADGVVELYDIHYLLRNDGLWNSDGTSKLLDHAPSSWTASYFSDGANLYSVISGSPRLIQQNFREFARGGYIDTDGNLRSMDGELITDEDDRGTDLADNGWRLSKEGLLKRYGVPILTHVTSFSLGCAVRSDGSIWNTVGVPFQIVGGSELEFSLNKTSLSLTETGSFRLTATLAGADPGRLIWETDQPGVAVPTDDGTVLALRAGQAVITVSTQDGRYSASCTVEVSPLSVVFDEKSLTVTGLLPGRTAEDVAQQTGAQLLYSDGRPADPGALIATGMQLVKDGSSYTAVVYGDLNGDGEINLSDLLSLTDEVLGKGEERLSGAALQAASLSRKEELNIFDITKLSDHILGRYILSQNA